MSLAALPLLLTHDGFGADCLTAGRPAWRFAVWAAYERLSDEARARWPRVC